MTQIQISNKAIQTVLNYKRRKEEQRNQLALMTELAFRSGGIPPEVYERITEGLRPKEANGEGGKLPYEQ